MGRLLIVFILPAVLFSSCHRKTHQQGQGIEVLPAYDTIYSDLEAGQMKLQAERLDKRFTQLYKRAGLNGSVLIAEKGKLLFAKSYGWRDVRRKKDPIQPEDAFQLASVSKVFTSTAALMLVQEGLLDLDEDIKHYLPDFPYEGISSRMLLSHRSGLSRYMTLAHENWVDKTSPLSNQDMLDLFVKYKPDTYAKPDQVFHYCNTNYALMANIIENVSGMFYDEFIEERIFKPLQMDDSFVFNMRGDTLVSPYINMGIPGYYHKRWRYVEARNEYLNGVMGDKNIYASALDLFKFDEALYNNTLLTDSLLQLAFSPGSEDVSKRKDNYGFGWRIRRDTDSTVYHFGWWKGFRNYYIRDMERERSLIVLTNKDRGPSSSVYWDIFQDTSWGLPERSRKND